MDPGALLAPAVSMGRAGSLVKNCSARSTGFHVGPMYLVPTCHRDRDGTLVVVVVRFWWGLCDVNGRREDGTAMEMINLRLHASKECRAVSLTVGTHKVTGLLHCGPSKQPVTSGSSDRFPPFDRGVADWDPLAEISRSRVTCSAFTKTISFTGGK